MFTDEANETMAARRGKVRLLLIVGGRRLQHRRSVRIRFASRSR
jgi:hypothetical protein